MKRKAMIWDFEKKEYSDYELPDGASLVENDMEKIIACAFCGRPLICGEGFTSIKIYNRFGLGYVVCQSCYEKEWEDWKENEENEP